MSPCVEWQGYVHPRTGYGQRAYLGMVMGAHRAAWIEANGRIPDGLMVLHSCDNRRCVALEHLRLGTHAENMRDRQERGRQARGLRHGRAKLSDLTVSEIRAAVAAGYPQKLVAADLGVSRSLVSFIVNGKRRADIAQVSP